MRNPIAVILLALLSAPLWAVDQPAPPTVTPKPEEKVREIFVPFEDLNVILESGPQRVMLSRREFQELQAKAKKAAETKAPLPALIASADYAVTAGDERAEIVGTLAVTVLEDGLHALGLDAAGVGIRAARLDDKSAPIGLADDGRLVVFVQGKGQHKLVLEMVAPLQTSAAWQTLTFRLPAPAASRMALTVPGDVEVKSGAAVVRRTFDEKAGQTRFELVPPRGDTSLVMSLNSRLRRKDRVVVARSVLVDEVTQAYERLHATVSLAVLHRAVDRFRFVVPAGFEVTDVRTPLLARWVMAAEGNQRILEVQLREETTDTVVLSLSALRTSPNLDAWAFPHLEPLDVAGHVAVIGLVAEDRLKAEAISPESLIPIDTSVLAQALPQTVLQAEPGAARIRPVAAYYAPQGAFGLAARFVRPPARLLVTTNLLLVLEDGGQQVRGGFSMLPEAEKLFAFDFSAPAGWEVTSVTGAGGEKLKFERYGAADAAGRIHVRLPQGLPAGQETRVYFEARSVPKNWFSEWTTATAEFPVFAVAGAARDVGAIAVQARDDMTVRPEALERLTPLDANEQDKYGLADVEATLAYRYEGGAYQARLAVERTRARLTAQTYSFFRVERDALSAHYELAFDVTEARARRLAILLPKDTPAALSIKGLDGVTIKEYTSEVVGEGAAAKRRWTAVLADARKGQVRIAVDFEQRLAGAAADLALPVVTADGVSYQSGLVAVEGSAELDVRVTESPRRVDIGELVDAQYQPGRRLLGAYGFVGDPPPVRVSVARPTGYGLPPAIIQRAELATVMSASGLGQTAARFLLRTKALFLEVKLPAGSTLWSATLDSKPAKPQREGDSILLSLPSGAEGTVHDLLVVYETPVPDLGLWKSMDVFAPRLYLHAGAETAGVEVPVADLQWMLYLPPGFRVVRSEGSAVTQQVARPTLAVASVAEVLWDTGGGVDFDHSALALGAGLVFLGGGAIQEVGGGRGREHGYYGAPATSETLHMFAEEAAPDANGRLERESRSNLLQVLRPKVAGPSAGKLSVKSGATLESLKATIATTPAAPPVAATPAPTAEPAAPPPPPAEQPPSAKREKSKKDMAGAWALEGISSLHIDIERTGEPITFQSLGADPRLDLTIADMGRLDSLAWGLALAVFLVGAAMTVQPVGRKVGYIIIVALVATLVPVITARIELALITNGMFYAACLLVPYYLVAAFVRWVAAKVRGRRWPVAVAVAAAVVIFLVLLAGAAMASAGEPPYVIQVVPPPEPVKVPADAIILPYDPASKTGIQSADRLLVPYEKYVELWNQAYPEKPIGSRPPPAPYALSGAAFAATLQGDEFLLVEGTVDIDVYTDGYAIVPLPLAGGVLARADLDGKPARLSVVESNPKPVPMAANVSAVPAPPQAFVVLYASGQGRHRLNLAVRMRLEKRGGWRVAEGRLPAAPATALALKAPDAGTEIRLGGVADRRSYETKAAAETINTALGADGAVSIQWRPKVSEGQIDLTLTADSTADLDVQEDQLRLRWSLALEFRRGEREFFTIDLPPGYLVEKVEGANVRGWEVKTGAAQPQLEVALLKRIKGSEKFAVTLWRAGPVSADASAKAKSPPEFDVPVVGVTGAARHSGKITIRRSPLIDLRTVSTSGVARTDLPADVRQAAKGGADESPLGIKPYQAYAFVATPFSIKLAAAPVAGRTSAAVQTILRVAERERKLESRVMLTAENRPLYRARIVVPADLKIDRVQAPGAFEWALTDEGGRKVLTVYLTTGVEGRLAIVIQGKLGQDVAAQQVDLPRIEVLDVDRQDGDIVVQADPGFEVRTEDLKGIERVLMSRVFGWLAEAQRGLAQVALHYGAADYAGRLVLVVRKPDASCFTVTNSRVTDRAIEETILINWTIKNAGVREVSFLLPAWMKDARISVPLLRQRTVTPVSKEPGAPVRVRLELQDEVMDELRVLVENDRLLTGGSQELPIPVVETGRTDRRYVALESAGRDEVVIEKTAGLEPLGRQQKEWAAVAGMLRGGTTQAFIVAGGAEAPQLLFSTKQRKAVETAAARIGLAQALLIMDPSGAYRVEQVYRIDNRTEQFLEVRLPDGAALWTARVAGEPVKPVAVADPARRGLIRVPLVKTAAGDLDYAVVLKYGGKLPALGAGRLSITFPLIREVSVSGVGIGIEQSQVELYLPETYLWFDFGGRMRCVTDEGDIAAGILAYENKRAEGLLQTLRFGNPFERARARANLKGLAQVLTESSSQVSAYQLNQSFQTEAASAQVIVQSASREIAGQAAQQGQAVADNNDLIRDAYGGQRNKRAKNQVAVLGLNWAETPPPQAAPQPDQAGRFNTAWFAGNRLETVQAGELKQADQKGQQRLDVSTLTLQHVGTAQGAQPSFANVAGGKPKGQAMQQQGQPGQQAQQAPAQQQTAEDVVQRYQQRLEQRAQQDQEVQRLGRLQVARGRGGGKEIRGFEGLASGGGAFFGARAEEKAEAAVPAGMASLDVELPRRGTVYRFTTPRGEVEITARAASLPLIEGLERLGAVVGLVIVVLVVRRFVRNRTLSPRGQGLVSTALIVLGIIGTVFGVFPLAGVAAVIVGIVMKVILRRARRRAAAAA